MRRILVMTMALAPVSIGTANAQFGRSVGDWMTSGGDAKRSSWIRRDASISRETLAKPGFQLLWKVNLGNDPKQSNALTEPVLLTSYIGYRGFRSLGFMGSGANSVHAVDTDLARIEWQKQLSSEPPAQGGSPGCTQGFIADVTRPTTAEIPSATAGPQGGGGRGGPARGAVGQPEEGAVTLAAALPALVPNAVRPPTPRPAGFRRVTVLHALSSDGMFHTMYVSNGE